MPRRISRILIFANFWICDILRILIFANFWILNISRILIFAEFFFLNGLFQKINVQGGLRTYFSIFNVFTLVTCFHWPLWHKILLPLWHVYMLTLVTGGLRTYYFLANPCDTIFSYPCDTLINMLTLVTQFLLPLWHCFIHPCDPLVNL